MPWLLVFFLSLFPSLIVLVAIISHVPLDNFMLTFNESLEHVMPADTRNYLFDEIITPQLGKRSGSLLSLSTVLALFFSSNGMMNLMRGFDKHHESTFRHRNGLQKRLVALKLTFLLGMLLIASMALIIFGKQFIHWFLALLNAGKFATICIKTLKIAVLVALFYAIISTIYRFGPALERRFPFLSPGATLATALSLLASAVFSFYVSHGVFNKFEGIIGIVIILMIWLQINAFVLIVGFELNASIARKQEHETLENG